MATRCWPTRGWHHGPMERILVLGRGGAGKTTFARRLGTSTGLRVVEVDKLFWQRGLVAMPREQWAALQQQLVAEDSWILDGDLGPNDALEVRLRAADTVILLDFSLLRCASRSVLRSRERLDYWRWMVSYRRRYLPTIASMIDTHAARARTLVFRNPRSANEFLAEVGQHRHSPGLSTPAKHDPLDLQVD